MQTGQRYNRVKQGSSNHRWLRLTLGGVAVLLGATALLLPATVPSTGHPLSAVNHLQSIALHMADVRRMASESTFPLPAALSYAGAVVLAIIVAFVTALSPFATAVRPRVVAGIPGARSGLIWPFLVIVVVSPFVLDLSVSEVQFTSGILKWIASSRIGMLLWAETIFLLMYTVSLWCLVQAISVFSCLADPYLTRF